MGLIVFVAGTAVHVAGVVDVPGYADVVAVVGVGERLCRHRTDSELVTIATFTLWRPN